MIYDCVNCVFFAKKSFHSGIDLIVAMWGWLQTGEDAHASKSSLFLQRLEVAIDSIAESVIRHTVVELPKKVLDWKQANSHKLDICSGYVSDETRNMIVEMLNDDWTISVKDRGGKLHHYCPPGCCESMKACQIKMKSALKGTVGSFFDVPLLYRWKHFDPAVQFTLRNLVIHGLLIMVWEATMNKSFDDGDIDLAAYIDADSADMAPAMKQKIRMGKFGSCFQKKISL